MNATPLGAELSEELERCIRERRFSLALPPQRIELCRLLANELLKRVEQ